MGSETQLEAVMALAELYQDMGQSAAALKVMHGLQGLGSASFTGTSSAALALLDRRARLLLRLGQQVGRPPPLLQALLRYAD